MVHLEKEDQAQYQQNNENEDAAKWNEEEIVFVVQVLILELFKLELKSVDFLILWHFLRLKSVVIFHPYQGSTFSQSHDTDLLSIIYFVFAHVKDCCHVMDVDKGNGINLIFWLFSARKPY